MLNYMSTPITANFIVTRNCNGNCAFCGVQHQTNSFQKDVSAKKLCKIIDKLYQADVLRINYFGGEPTVHPELLSIMKYSKKLKFFNSIVTNGLYIPKKISQYKEVIDALAVSLHGLKEEHCKLGQVNEDAYNRILKNLKIYTSLGIPITINMTVTPENYKSIPQFADFLLRLFPISAFAFNRYIPSPSVMQSAKKKYVMNALQLNESLEKIDNAARQHPNVQFRYAIHFPYCIVKKSRMLKYIGNCGFGQNYISVDCNGNLQTCSYSNQVLGNIFEDDLRSIWQNHKVLVQYRGQNWLPVECHQCCYLLKCAAGCKMTGEGAFSPDYLLKEVKNIE